MEKKSSPTCRVITHTVYSVWQHRSQHLQAKLGVSMRSVTVFVTLPITVLFIIIFCILCMYLQRCYIWGREVLNWINVAGFSHWLRTFSRPPQEEVWCQPGKSSICADGRLYTSHCQGSRQSGEEWRICQVFACFALLRHGLYFPLQFPPVLKFLNFETCTLIFCPENFHNLAELHKNIYLIEMVMDTTFFVPELGLIFSYLICYLFATHRNSSVIISGTVCFCAFLLYLIDQLRVFGVLEKMLMEWATWTCGRILLLWFLLTTVNSFAMW